MARNADKTALVLGAAGGTGQAIVTALVDAGWRVIASDLTVERQPERGGVTWIAADVTDDASVQALANQIGDGLDAVIYSAGVLGVGALAQMPIARIERTLQINTVGALRVVQACLPALTASRGRVVVISSEAATQKGAPFNGPYALSKTALDAAADSLRHELGLLGIEVVKVQPGPIRTPMVAGITEAFDRAADEAPLFADTLRRVGGIAGTMRSRPLEPDAVASVVLEALTARRPKATYALGFDRGRALLDRLPTRVSEAVTRRVLRGDA